MAQKLNGSKGQKGGYSTETTLEYFPNTHGPMLVVCQPERQEGWNESTRDTDGVFKKLKLQVVDAEEPVAEPFSLSVLTDVDIKLGDIINFSDDVEACEIYCRNRYCVHSRKPDVYFRVHNANVVSHVDFLAICKEKLQKEEL